jgi:DNA helicase-2/ATP-dependent DNA helicase PcrA
MVTWRPSARVASTGLVPDRAAAASWNGDGMNGRMLLDLNAAQRVAVKAISGPILVVAGAGTGKTRVVTYRIANLIACGIDPARILAVTFTNKAAQEMQRRVRQLLDRQRPSRPEIATFHAYCAQVLRRHIAKLGYPTRFSIYSTGQQLSVARSALGEVQSARAALQPGDLVQRINRWKSRSVTLEQALELADADADELAAAAFRRYQLTIQSQGAVDFDDLLLLTQQLFARFPETRRVEAGRFDHLLVDEYQDTNASQYRIVRVLAAGHRNLCVVGDDDQSIYGWRGARVQHVLNFRRDWPDAKVVKLEENYRSTNSILRLANRLIRFNKHRHLKRLHSLRGEGRPPRLLTAADEVSEARCVVADLGRRLRHGRRQPGDFAILFRTNEQPRPFEAELRRRQLPYTIVGSRSFFDRKEVLDTLAFISVLDDPHDESSLLRILNVPPRGLGPTSVAALRNESIRQRQPMWETLRDPSALPGIPAAAAAQLRSFGQMIDHYRSLLGNRPASQLVKSLLDRVTYRAELARRYSDVMDQQARWAAVEDLINSLAEYERRSATPTLREFLNELALRSMDPPNNNEKKLQQNAVCLMTLHAAKGLEFPCVYLVGLEEGLLPHRRSLAGSDGSIDEERRLCYVGLTRAQQELTVSWARSRRKWGKQRPTRPSQFLQEILGPAFKPVPDRKVP